VWQRVVDLQIPPVPEISIPRAHVSFVSIRYRSPSFGGGTRVAGSTAS
jgi:hypothetical protein